jgi:hypothetical protein
MNTIKLFFANLLAKIKSLFVKVDAVEDKAEVLKAKLKTAVQDVKKDLK